MRLIGLAGWSGSGKTTLLVKLLPVLIARGRSVSTLKHAHHAFDVDQPGKDSHNHRLAGAHEVLISSARRWALMHELRDEAEPTLAELVPHLSPVDLVIVEGFKAENSPEARGASQRRRQAAVVSQRSEHPRDCERPAADESRRCRRPILNDIEAIADLVDELARPYPP